MASIKILLKTNKTLSDGRHPIAIRIIKDRKTKFIFTGKHSLKEHWDENMGLPNKKHPLYKELTIYLKTKMLNAETELMDLEKDDQHFTADTVKETLQKSRKGNNAYDYYTKIVNELEILGKISSRNMYKFGRDSLSKFVNGSKNIPFSHIDMPFLMRYEKYLYAKGLQPSSIYAYMDNLKAMFNRAVKEKVIKRDAYPFAEYEMITPNTPSAHRAMGKENIEKIFKYKAVEGTKEFEALKYFTFSYYCWGINMVDIAKLKWKDIQNNRLVYVRSKTGRLYNLPVLEPAQEILKYYKKNSTITHDEDYIFPILERGKHITPHSIAMRTTYALRYTNTALKDIAKKVGYEGKVTTYMARHTFATNLRNMDISTAKIQNMLGHTTEKTTQVYLDSFKNNELDDAAMLLLG
jgi:integrase/recombinase XerD